MQRAPYDKQTGRSVAYEQPQPWSYQSGLLGSSSGRAAVQCLDGPSHHSRFAALFSGQTVSRLRRGGLAIGRPFLGKLAAFLEQVAATIRSLNLVADGMRERHFGDLVREIRPLRHPVAEGAAKAMHRQTIAAETAQAHQ